MSNTSNRLAIARPEPLRPRSASRIVRKADELLRPRSASRVVVPASEPIRGRGCPDPLCVEPAPSVPAVRGDFAAVRYLKQAEDSARARAEVLRAGAGSLAIIAVILAVVFQLGGQFFACAVCSGFSLLACAVLLLLAAASERRAESLRAAGFEGLSGLKF